MAPKVFRNIQLTRPGRSLFNLSHSRLFTGDLGILYPIMVQEAVPGDVMSISCKTILRFLPAATPFLHEVNIYVHYFFVPYRILWSDWEEFITGGEDGTSAPSIPVWTAPTSYAAGSLWDYLGGPASIIPTNICPNMFGLYAYNMIYNEYYRNQNIITAVALTQENLLNSSWEPDYYVTALPWFQRGTAPALPISGTTQAVFDGNVELATAGVSASNQANMLMDAVNRQPYNANTDLTILSYKAKKTGSYGLDDNEVDLSAATTFDVNDLRLAISTQKWLERNARAGSRYREFLLAHFGYAPKDERLQRPEYIGGCKIPVMVSEVLQHSKTDGTAYQGTMTGHALGAGSKFCGKVRVSEYGLIMGILKVMPRAIYQDGVDRELFRRTKLDFYFPEFQQLGEQQVIRGELYTSGTGSQNLTVFGYQGRFNEMRIKRSTVHGLMRTTYDKWHISRQFGSAPALNSTFINCSPRKDYLLGTTEPAVMVHHANIVKAIRPLTSFACPK